MKEEKQSYRRQSGCEAAYKMKKSGMMGCFGVGENEKNQNKMRYEKIIMNISLIGSILFMLSEGFMAYYTKSHSLLMDCIFDVTDL